MLMLLLHSTSPSVSFYLTRVMYCLCDVVNEKLSRDCKSSAEFMSLFVWKAEFLFASRNFNISMKINVMTTG